MFPLFALQNEDLDTFHWSANDKIMIKILLPSRMQAGDVDKEKNPRETNN